MESDLESALAELYPDKASITRVLETAGVDTSRVNWFPSAINTWHGIFQESRHQGHVVGILAVAESEYPRHAPLTAAIDDWRIRTQLVISPADITQQLGRHEQRLNRIEAQVKAIWRHIDPSIRRRVSLVMAALILLAAWTLLVILWDWYIANPIQALVINILFALIAGLFYWLGAEDTEREA